MSMCTPVIRRLHNTAGIPEIWRKCKGGYQPPASLHPTKNGGRTHRCAPTENRVLTSGRWAHTQVRPCGIPTGRGQVQRKVQRSTATKVKTLLFCCRILYFFFYKSSLLSLHWKEKTLKKPGLMRFFESYPLQRTCNQPATNLQRSGRFCLELSSCKGQLSCFFVIFSKFLVRCREFVAGNVPFPPLLPAVSGKHPWI